MVNASFKLDIWTGCGRADGLAIDGFVNTRYVDQR